MTILDQIRARTDAATEGPWEEYDANEGTDYSPLWCVANEAFHNPPDDEEAEWVGVEIHVGDKEDAQFIAHARQDVPLLLDAVDTLLSYADLLDKGADMAEADGMDCSGNDTSHRNANGIRRVITQALEGAS